MNIRKIYPSIISIVLMIGGVFSIAEEFDLTGIDSDWIILHMLVHVDQLKDVVPDFYRPGLINLNPYEDEKDTRYYHVLLICRTGDMAVEVGGKRVIEEDISDVILGVIVEHLDSKNQHLRALLVLDYFTDNPLLTNMLLSYGVHASSLTGEIKRTNLPDGRLALETTMKVGSFSSWQFTARSKNTTKYEFPFSEINLIFGEVKNFEAIIRLDGHFYMFAKSLVEGLHDNFPLDRFGDWIWAYQNTYLASSE